MLTIVWLAAGCISQPGSSRTEAMRRDLNPQVRAMLEEAGAALEGGQFDRAMALADSVEFYAPELADIPFLRGRAYVARGQYDEAREAFLRTLELDPEFAGARKSLGDIEAARGLPGDALPYYIAEAEQYPGSGIYEQIGSIYADAGRADSARRAFDKAIALDSTNASAYMQYSLLLEQLGEVDEALRYSRKALSIQPDVPNYQFVVGAQLFRSGRVEEAVRYLQSAADAQPLHYPAQYNLGQALLQMDREEAWHYFARADTARVVMDQINLVQQAIARQPAQAGYWVRLGELYQRVDMSASARNAFDTALRLDPGNPAAHHGLARMALADGNTADAIRRYKLILVADRERSEAWLELGRAYAASGQCEEARDAWHTARELGSDSIAAVDRPGELCREDGQ